MTWRRKEVPRTYNIPLQNVCVGGAAKGVSSELLRCTNRRGGGGVWGKGDICQFWYFVMVQWYNGTVSLFCFPMVNFVLLWRLIKKSPSSLSFKSICSSLFTLF